MGEWSKSIGEKGEKVTSFIFEEILGVNSLVENISSDCQRGEKHKRKEAKSNRTTHGIDGLYYYESPLEDELLDVAIISSKYCNGYPKYPKSDFKSHITDLAQALECFKLSKFNNDISQNYSSVSKTNYTGILVWLSNSDEAEFELIPKVSNTIIDSNLDFEKIILLDNARINFLYESVYKTQEKFAKTEYVYHNSSINQNSINSKAYGSIFPIEYLYSDIIILRVEESNQIQFLIFINDNFNINNLKLILSFAKSFDYLNATDKTIINYIDYDELQHKSILKNVLSSYPNFKLGKNLELNKFPLDYRR